MVVNTTASFLFWLSDKRRIDFKLLFLISDFFLSGTCIIFWMILVSLLLSCVPRHHGQCGSRLKNKQPPIRFSAVAHGLCLFTGYMQCALSCLSVHSYPWVWQYNWFLYFFSIRPSSFCVRHGQPFHWPVLGHPVGVVYLLYLLYWLGRDGHRLGLDRVGHIMERVGSSQRLLGLLLTMRSMLGQLKARNNWLPMFHSYR